MAICLLTTAGAQHTSTAIYLDKSEYRRYAAEKSRFYTMVEMNMINSCLAAVNQAGYKEIRLARQQVCKEILHKLNDHVHGGDQHYCDDTAKLDKGE